MEPTTIVGVDPSSRKLACVVTDTALSSWEVHTEKLPGGSPRENCRAAQEWVRRFFPCLRHGAHVYQEAPIIGGGMAAWATIPQSMVAGVVMASLPAHVRFTLLHNTEWKSRVVGKGSASKAEASAYLQEAYPDVYDLTVRTKKPDQDLVDAACIALFGVQDAILRKKIDRAVKGTACHV